MAEHQTQAVLGWGTTIGVVGFGEIHEVRTAAPPQSTADEVDVTHFWSPKRTKEFIQGMVDSGEFTFEVNWRPDVYPDHRRLREDSQSGMKRTYTIALPGDMEIISVPGFVKTLAPTLAPSDAVVMAVTIRCDAQTVEFS